MILTIDVGNTSIVFGVFDGEKLKASWRVSTKTRDLYFQGIGAKEKNDIKSVIISSVVPNIESNLLRQIKETFGLVPTFVSAKNIDLKIKLKNKAEIGADRLVNAFAVKKLYGAPAIIIDFGTATTFCAINRQGQYIGGAIAPGVAISREALHEKTAKLPLVDIRFPKKVIGDSTLEAIRSGLYYGYISMIEGMVRRFKDVMGGTKVKVVATGGFSTFLENRTKIFDIVDPHLTLTGLRLIWEDMNG